MFVCVCVGVSVCVLEWVCVQVCVCECCVGWILVTVLYDSFVCVCLGVSVVVLKSLCVCEISLRTQGDRRFLNISDGLLIHTHKHTHIHTLNIYSESVFVCFYIQYKHTRTHKHTHTVSLWQTLSITRSRPPAAALTEKRQAANHSDVATINTGSLWAKGGGPILWLSPLGMRTTVDLQGRKV